MVHGRLTVLTAFPRQHTLFNMTASDWVQLVRRTESIAKRPTLTLVSEPMLWPSIIRQGQRCHSSRETPSGENREYSSKSSFQYLLPICASSRVGGKRGFVCEMKPGRGMCADSSTVPSLEKSTCILPVCVTQPVSCPSRIHQLCVTHTHTHISLVPCTIVFIAVACTTMSRTAELGAWPINQPTKK